MDNGNSWEKKFEEKGNQLSWSDNNNMQQFRPLPQGLANAPHLNIEIVQALEGKNECP